MLSKFISLGNRIDLQSLERSKNPDEDTQKVYASKVYEILSEDTLEITMPMEHTRLILLSVDSELDLVFYGESGLYQCFARIVDRYKTNNVYLLKVELTSNLRKYQRREYYRFSCALEMKSRSLQEEEQQSTDDLAPYMLNPDLPMRQSVIVDISGGGLRFMSDYKYEVGSLIYCRYHLLKGGVNKEYEVIGKVITVQEVENRPGVYEHRAQYYNMDVLTREEIIKYIFEEERRNRQRENRF